VNSWQSILPFVLIAVVFWFLIVRPARNQQKKMSATQRSVAVGSEVMLGSGIYGRVSGIDDETFDVEIAPGTTMKVAKAAVVRVIEPRESEESAELPEAAETTGPTETPPSAADDKPSSDQDR
jgi:preprotein translocase subunit YajC